MLCAGEMRENDEIVAIGYTALSGTAKAVQKKESLLLERFSPSYVRSCGAIERFGVASIGDLLPITSYCVVGEGGVYRALWEYFREKKYGFEMELRALPFRQETIEVCEVLDLNPYRLESKGLILVTTAHGVSLVSELKKKGIPAVVVGKVTRSIGKRLLNGEIETFLDRPQPDELTKL